MEQGIRTGGAAGPGLLAEAVAAYRAALDVYTSETLPLQWAMTQNNLGNALQKQGVRTGGAAGVELLAEAVVAYRAALEVYACETLSLQWATAQNGLGTALSEQGIRMGGAAGAKLLQEAVAAFRATLEVVTPKGAPRYHEIAIGNLKKIETRLNLMRNAED